MKKSNFFFFIPVCLGALIFLLIVGPRVLDPTNIAWLSNVGDTSTAYLGWDFFRNDQWRLPFALNPNYGLELSSSVLYSDSNVLLAFIFKSLSVFLPKTFQYFGIWLLLCFVLQAYAGWKIVGLISDNFFICLLGSIIFLFSPIFLWRLYGHYNLLGHFFIIISLYIIIKQDQVARKWQWPILLICVSLVHSYLAAMVIALWFTDLVICLITKKILYKNFIKECLEMSAILLITLWMGGYFAMTGKVNMEYGIYRMNLLSPFNSSGWSYILKPLPECSGNYEGFNYLGLGNLFLLLWTIPLYIANRKKIIFARKYYPLLILFIGFTLFAISSEVSFLNYNFHLFTPDFYLFRMFRASGRFFWPVFYVIIFLCIWIIVKFNKLNVAIFMLVLSVFVQIMDTHIVWSDFRKNFMVARSSIWNTPLTDSFWGQAAQHYSKLRAIPPMFWMFKDWAHFAEYADKNGMKIDFTYLARLDPKILNRLNQHNANMCESGMFEKDTLYLIHEDYVSSVKQNIDMNKDLITNIDGFYILAPNWNVFEK